MSGSIWFKVRIVDTLPGLKNFQAGELAWAAKVTDNEWWVAHEFGAAILTAEEAKTILKSFQPRQFNDALGRGLWAANKPASRKQLNYLLSLVRSMNLEFAHKFFDAYGLDEDPETVKSKDLRWMSSVIASGMIDHARRCPNMHEV